MREHASRQITINALKYDGELRRSWEAGLIREGPDLIVAVGVFEQSVRHNDLGLIQKGTVSFEYFWPGRWYNVFRFAGPDGGFRNFYCNIAMPPRVHGDVLEFVDLDIDLVVWPDGHREVLDLGEFEMNSERYSYSDEVRFKALHALDDLIRSIETADFPFDQATDATIANI